MTLTIKQKLALGRAKKVLQWLKKNETKITKESVKWLKEIKNLSLTPNLSAHPNLTNYLTEIIRYPEDENFQEDGKCYIDLLELGEARILALACNALGFEWEAGE